jgi:hypothetical protein
VVNGVGGLRVEGKDAGIISRLNSYSSSNEGVQWKRLDSYVLG